MSVRLDVKGKSVNHEYVEGWEISPLDSSDWHGINLNLNGTQPFLREQGFIRIDDFESKDKAEAALATILENIIEAEKNGGGVVVV